MPTVREFEQTETQWQAQVIELAHLLGWKHLHVRRSIGKGKQWVTATNRTGWVDLTFWHPIKGGLIFVELKSNSGQVKPEQAELHEELRAAGFSVYVWRPDQLDEVKSILSNPPGRPYQLPV